MGIRGKLLMEVRRLPPREDKECMLVGLRQAELRSLRKVKLCPNGGECHKNAPSPFQGSRGACPMLGVTSSRLK